MADSPRPTTARRLAAGFAMDLRLAWRSLWRRKAFLALVVGVLACGVGSAVAGYGMYEAMVLKPVPYPRPDQLVQIALAHDSRPLEAEAFYRQDLIRAAARRDVFDSTAEFRTSAASLSGLGRSERLEIGLVSPSLFPLLGVQPSRGRTFTPEDAAPGAQPVVLLSDAVWRLRFNADPEIIGRELRVDLIPATVVGIMPPGFGFPHQQQLWRPLADAVDGDADDVSRTIAVGRLAPGVALTSAAAALEPVVEDARARAPDRYRGYRVRLQPLSWFFVDWQARDGQRLLLIAVLALLVVALANTAGLMLSHSRTREPEWQVRAALGAAGGGRLLGGLAAGVIVAAPALALALPLARFGLRWMEGQLWQSEDPSPYFMHLDLTVASVTVGAAAAVVAALVAGFLPALLPGAGSDARPASHSRVTSSTAATRLAGGLVAMQVALSLVIVVVMTVMVQAVQAMGHRELGITRTNILTARLTLPAERYPDPAARGQFWSRLSARLRQVPGATDATVASAVPGFRGDDEAVQVEGAEPGRDRLRVSTGIVDERFLSTYGIRIREGRDFTDRDTSEPVAIVDRRFAETAWPGRNAVGRRVRVDRPGGEWSDVIGVVDSLHLAQVDDPPRASVLVYRGRVNPSSSAVALRTEGPPYDVLPVLQEAVQELDADLPLYLVYSLGDAIEHGHAGVNVAARVLGWLGACALLVAAAGLYAMLAVRVSERTRDIGVRRAIGAGSGRITRTVLGMAVTPLAAGLVAGLLAAWPAARSLVAIEPTVITMDVSSFGWAAAVLGAAVLMALLGPLARALAIDPIRALRES